MRKNIKKIISCMVLAVCLSATFVSRTEAENSNPKKAVILNILAEDTMSGIEEMMISNYSDFRDAKWEKYTEEKEWILLENHGENKVYIKIKDKQQNISEIFEMIVEAPNEDVLVDAKAELIQNNKSDMKLLIKMPENEELKEMKFSNDNITFTEWKKYNTDSEYIYLNANEGENILYLKVKDSNNNEYSKELVINKPSIYSNGVIISNNIDAVSGYVLAANHGMSLVVFEGSSDSAEGTLNFVSENVPKEADIYILGGKYAVPISLEKELKNKNYKKVKRIAGEYKNDTSKLIAEAFTESESRNVIVFAKYKGSKLSKEVAETSVEKQYPIMYSNKTTLLQGTKDAIKELNSKVVYLIGSKDEISDLVIKEIEEINDIKVIRIDSVEKIKNIK